MSVDEESRTSFMGFALISKSKLTVSPFDDRKEAAWMNQLCLPSPTSLVISHLKSGDDYFIGGDEDTVADRQS
jgi:hypothetical protein